MKKEKLMFVGLIIVMVINILLAVLNKEVSGVLGWSIAVLLYWSHTRIINKLYKIIDLYKDLSKNLENQISGYEKINELKTKYKP